MNHGAVIAAAKGIADLLERMLGECPSEEHRDLSWNGDVVGAALARHVAVTNLEVVCDAFLDSLDRQNILRLLHEDVVEESLCRCEVERLARERGVAGNLEQRAF